MVVTVRFSLEDHSNLIEKNTKASILYERLFYKNLALVRII